MTSAPISARVCLLLNIQSEIIHQIRQQCSGSPRYVELPEFKFSSPRPFTFVGFLKDCGNDELALKLCCLNEQDALPDVTRIEWDVFVRQTRNTRNKICEEGKLGYQSYELDSANDDGSNYMILDKELFQNGDGSFSDVICVKWGVTVKSTDNGDKIELSCRVEIELLKTADKDKTAGTTTQKAPPKKPRYFEVKLGEKKKDGDPSSCYPMNAKPRGNCLVFNNKFDGQENQRDGTEKDAEALGRIFKELHFNVHLHDDLKKEDMLKVLKETASQHENNNNNNNTHDCFVCCILSHGRNGCIDTADSEELRISEIIDIFSAKNCPHLHGKPKLFFIEACRGTQVSEAVPSSDRYGKVETDSPTDTDIQYIPDQADFLLGYSTVAGHASFRNCTGGSYYIQILTDVISKYHKDEDVYSLLTQVNKQVGDVTFGCEGSNKLCKQTPVIQSTLRRKLFL